MGTIVCSCGLENDPAEMKKIGWQSDADGNAQLLANCVGCRSTRVIEERSGCAICATCRRLVTGQDGDVKVSVVDAAEGPLIFCRRCYERDPRRDGWTAWEAPTGPMARPMLAEASP